MKACSKCQEVKREDAFYQAEPCNHAIGFLRDDPVVIRSAAEYVESFRKLRIA